MPAVRLNFGPNAGIQRVTYTVNNGDSDGEINVYSLLQQLGLKIVDDDDSDGCISHDRGRIPHHSIDDASATASGVEPEHTVTEASRSMCTEKANRSTRTARSRSRSKKITRE